MADLALVSKIRSLAAVKCTKGAFHVTMGLESCSTNVFRRMQLREHTLMRKLRALYCRIGVPSRDEMTRLPME